MLSRVIILLMTLLVRRLLIDYIGNEVNGLNYLYASIIGMLSVAELGVGSAIVFSMYKPIVSGDDRSVAALYRLYRRLYRIIGAVIFAAGIAVMPFLPRLISDYEAVNVNVYLTYFLTLISIVLSYLYSAKTSLIEAHKNNYITTGILTFSRILRYLMQIAAILIWRSYVIFVICQIIETLLVWILTEAAVNRLYPEIIRRRETLDKELASEVSKNVRAMFMHKIGEVFVLTIDSVIISAFVGVAILGKYSNYSLIATGAASIISLFFTPLTAVVGHLCASEDTEEIKKYFNYFYSFNLVVGIVFFLGYFAIVDNLVQILFGSGLEMSRVVSSTITLNSFVGYMRMSQQLFNNASGTFYYDRWKPIAESLCNLTLSLLFVITFPEEYAVAGVIAATIITNLVICDIVEPYVLYKYVLKQSSKGFCIRNYINVGIFTICLLIVSRLMVAYESSFAELVVNGLISVGVSMTVIILYGLIDREFGRECLVILNQLRSWLLRLRKRIAGFAKFE